MAQVSLEWARHWNVWQEAEGLSAGQKIAALSGRSRGRPGLWKELCFWQSRWTNNADQVLDEELEL